jgi:hypothetical protein
MSKQDDRCSAAANLMSADSPPTLQSKMNCRHGRPTAGGGGAGRRTSVQGRQQAGRALVLHALAAGCLPWSRCQLGKEKPGAFKKIVLITAEPASASRVPTALPTAVVQY